MWKSIGLWYHSLQTPFSLLLYVVQLLLPKSAISYTVLPKSAIYSCSCRINVRFSVTIHMKCLHLFPCYSFFCPCKVGLASSEKHRPTKINKNKKSREDPKLRVNVGKKGRVFQDFRTFPRPSLFSQDWRETGVSSPVSDKRSPCGGILALLRCLNVWTDE